jgi:3-dehydroquinate synthase
MDSIKVNLNITEDKSYDIVIKEGVLAQVAREVKNEGLAYRFAIITDKTVEYLYGKKLYEDFLNHDLLADIIAFPAGEKYKNRETKAWIEDRMLENNFARDSAVIALGGGVVGDMAGYVAATYTRGLPYVQIPTTLVACVDSSIGGKTAVDTPHGKNLIGSFHQPWRVYIDVETLSTLDEKEIREGLAEVIKYGVISDDSLFSYVENNLDKIFSYDHQALTHIVRRGCEIKARVVERDERESDLRKILNFGHTIGHAVENLSDYTVSHGQAISIGMVAEGELALEMGLWKKEEQERLTALLEKAGLRTSLPDGSDIQDIIKTMKLDKKSRTGRIEMVLPETIGGMSRTQDGYAHKMDESFIEKVL